MMKKLSYVPKNVLLELTNYACGFLLLILCIIDM